MTAVKPTVTEAISLVMEEVQAIKKGDRNTMQNYNFRGIDAVVNAVGPVLRKHGVIVTPVSASCESEHYTTAKGALMRGVTLTVGFRFYGPNGDFIEAQVCGEASDSGDKAVPKAHSVAYRTLLLQALCIPTDEPDPNASSYDRGKAKQESAADLTVELLALAEQLGAKDATAEAVARHRDDVAWLKRQIATAKKNVKSNGAA